MWRFKVSKSLAYHTESNAMRNVDWSGGNLGRQETNDGARIKRLNLFLAMPRPQGPFGTPSVHR